MNRRSFLTSLAAALTLDPERALWVPGQKLISIPKPKVYSDLYSKHLRLLLVAEAEITKDFLMDLDYWSGDKWVHLVNEDGSDRPILLQATAHLAKGDSPVPLKLRSRQTPSRRHMGIGRIRA